ncbi:MAG TPA: 16S rRNA (uracil(1498)-N(3))-methyltransferase [Hyphomicrobiales bacterium]|nr:16S rRNA (uracil(1498)-N(3))-methyltransferase [Hyphomicrobiales bacterium]
MATYDFAAPRLFVDAALAEGADIALDSAQGNYLRNVLRLGAGDTVLAFNGRDGEWRARIAAPDRRRAALAIGERLRPQTPPGDLWYLFAPLKHARLDYMVQKAVEMGASRLVPVLTRRTQVSRVNLERMRANAIEAAEQCGILSLPDIVAPAPLEQVVRAWPEGRRLVFCDEGAPVGDAMAVLRALSGQPTAVLIGPEGGFDPAERVLLGALPGTVAISLGPRVLRADTAAVAALALVQAACGDWTG